MPDTQTFISKGWQRDPRPERHARRCPFCGSKILWIWRTTRSKNTPFLYQYAIECGACGATMAGETDVNRYVARGNVVNRWNKRSNRLFIWRGGERR